MLVVSLGVDAIFLSVLYQNLLLASLIISKPIVGFRTSYEMVRALLSYEYKWYAYEGNGMSAIIQEGIVPACRPIMMALRSIFCYERCVFVLFYVSRTS